LMTGMGMGITLLPALYVKSEIGSRDDDVKVVKMEGPRIFRSIGLVVRGTTLDSGAAEKIAEMIQSVARNNFGGLLFLEEALRKASPD